MTDIAKRLEEIMDELVMLNQFIPRTSSGKKLLNLLNGCQVTASSEYLYLRWELVEVKGKDIESGSANNRLELSHAEKYLRLMKKQSKSLD